VDTPGGWRAGRRACTRLSLFGIDYALPQPKLFDLGTLREAEYLKELGLEAHAPRRPGQPQALRDVLFPFSPRWA
jgi:hypothetical protein